MVSLELSADRKNIRNVVAWIYMAREGCVWKMGDSYRGGSGLWVDRELAPRCTGARLLRQTELAVQCWATVTSQQGWVSIFQELPLLHGTFTINTE